MTAFDWFIRIADRLGQVQVQVGSFEADRTIHQALGRGETPAPYTTEEEAARGLLPAGFEWLEATYAGAAVYVACRRSGMDGEFLHPHHGQWGATLPLAMARAVMRAHAKLVKE